MDNALSNFGRALLLSGSGRALPGYAGSGNSVSKLLSDLEERLFNFFIFKGARERFNDCIKTSNDEEGDDWKLCLLSKKDHEFLNKLGPWSKSNCVAFKCVSTMPPL